jgi:Na+/H+ antiporter NhaD/arsenite permease-like protein
MNLDETLVVATAVLVCVCVMFPVRFRITCHRGLSRLRLRLDYATASVCGVLFLHFLDVVSLREMAGSLWSVGHVQPLAVLLIFFTLAYASISLDVTGFSRFVALTVLRSESVGHHQDTTAGGSESRGRLFCEPSRRLLIEVYLLSGIIALIASNDVVILTLTPVLLHFCDAQRILPHKVVYIEYVAANTWSAFLLIGNPTNIIAGQAMQMTFARYVVLLWMPTVVVIVATLGVVWIVTPTAPPPEALYLDERCASLDLDGVPRREEAVHAAVADELPAADAPCSLYVKTITSTISVALASPMEPPDHVAAAVDELRDRGHRHFTAPPEGVAQGDITVSPAPSLGLADANGARMNGVILGLGVVLLILCGYTPIPMFAVTSVTCGVILFCDLFRQRTDPGIAPLDQESCATWWRRSRVCQVCERMPWAVAPFASSMFILVDALSKRGVTSSCSGVLVAVSKSLGTFPATLLVMLVVVVAMNLLNNQPATILLSVILLEASTASPDSTVDTLPDAMSRAAFIALSLGSNVAAVFTPKGALAGILWESILTHHGVSFPAIAFLKSGMTWMLFPTVVGGVACYLAAILFS